MSKQGLVVKTVAGKVVLKVVSGCDGDNINKLAVRLQQGGLTVPAEIHAAAIEAGLGCASCLVVQTVEEDYFKGDGGLSPLYRERFSDPLFNPRKASGEIERFVSIDLPAPSG